jgi:isopentenyl-diphosphate delta-isomerase
MEELVVLVDKDNQQIGTALKAKIHTANTPLHRGFSVFLFNSRGELLLQQRSRVKKTFPLVWSNSVCGHPGAGETPIEAARRRLKNELGINDVKEIHMILPDYRYRAEMGGIVENELCPVLVAFSDKSPKPHKDEVENTRWIPWSKFLKEAREIPSKYSSWSTEEALLLENSKKFKSLYAALL